MTGVRDRNGEKILSEVAAELLEDLRKGEGDEQKRRQAEDWLRSLSDKHPDLDIRSGLRVYYLAEAERLRERFSKSSEMIERLEIGRSIESFLEKAAELSPREEEESD